mmetsp:Transcript_16637/g.32235  ORF Transcript_16637/g.32235 Transcript_16637/m.32235 type:complete len:270 (-) Transcript_16637:316-1125(-)
MPSSHASSTAAAAFAVTATALLVFLRRYRQRCALLGYDLAASFRNGAPFQNEIFLVRHGQSEANVAGIISSHPDVGTKKHTLTPRGEEQARRAGNRLKAYCAEKGIPEDKIPENVIVRCSDFTRTRRTAAIVAEELGVPASEVQTCIEFRERFFGSFDGQSDEKYKDVWNFDEHSILHEQFGAESIASVLKRAAGKIVALDREFKGKIIVIVAHGDVLQISRTGFQGEYPPALHRYGDHLQTGSVSKLERTPLSRWQFLLVGPAVSSSR